MPTHGWSDFFFFGRRAAEHGRHAFCMGPGSRGWHGGHGPMSDWGGMGGGGGRITRGRKFGADDLQLMLLVLLEEQPRHGYELIKELENRSNGFYSPSPGMVYPALTYLEELDYATVEANGNRKRYHLAEAGRRYLDTNRDRAQQMFSGLEHMARKMAWMKKIWGSDTSADAQDESGWLPEFVEARRTLRMALMRRHDATPDEQRRIADILQRASAEILREDTAPPGRTARRQARPGGD